MTELERWFVKCKPGELMTQLSKTHFAELVQDVLAGVDFDVLFQSERKADRTRAKWLLCISNLCQHPALLAELLTTDWRRLCFRKAADGRVDVEQVVMRRR